MEYSINFSKYSINNTRQWNEQVYVSCTKLLLVVMTRVSTIQLINMQQYNTTGRNMSHLNYPFPRGSGPSSKKWFLRPVWVCSTPPSPNKKLSWLVWPFCTDHLSAQYRHRQIHKLHTMCKPHLLTQRQTDQWFSFKLQVDIGRLYLSAYTKF